MHVWRRVAVGLLAGAVLVVGIPAMANTFAPQAVAPPPVLTPSGLVSQVPRTNLPKISDGEINDIEVIGDRVFVAGNFSSIANPGAAAIPQRSLASYNLATGRVDTAFRPTFDGSVAAVEASPDGSALYVTGSFNNVNGVQKRKIAKLNPATGAPIAAFTANGSAAGNAIAVSNNAVYVGGTFKTVNGVSRVGLVALNPTTGAVDQGFNLPISGGIGVGGMLTVQQLKLTSNFSKLLVVHTGRQIAGQDRMGVGLVDTATKQLLPWHSRLWEENIGFVGGIQRVYAGDIAPNDQYFVVTSGSGGDRPPINDTAMAFPINGGEGVQPLWVSRHFDSVYSVEITPTAVYVGGHFSWQESPTATQPWPGRDDVGYGTGQGLSGYGLGDEVVRRDHLGALDPATGTALPWNPGSGSFQGEKAMEWSSRGLLVGGDSNTKGTKAVGRVALFETAAAPVPTPVDTSIDDPIEGRVKTAGEPFTITGQAVAPAGVTRVQVEIQNRATKRFLQDDLVTWGSNNNVLATLGEVGSPATTWSLTVSLPAAEYNVQAKAFGGNGSSDPTKAIRHIETFSFTDLPPTTRISNPRAGLLATTTFLVTGTASDDVGVTGMTYWFRNGNGNYLQNDGTVASRYNSFSGEPDVVGATSTTWQYEVTLPNEGQWRMGATAIDTAGQPDLRSEVRDWTVSTTGVPPTITITAPVAMTPPTTVPVVNVTPGQRVTFSGVATDEDQLRSVEVSLRNSTTREALGADGTWGVGVTSGFFRVSPVNLSAPTYNWTWTSPVLTPGNYDFRVQATDNLELTTSSSNSGRLTLLSQVPGDAFPNGTLSFTGTNQNIDVLHLDLTGTGTDDHGVQAVRFSLRDQDTGRYLQPGGNMAATFATIPGVVASPGATTSAFSLSVNLPTKGEWSVEAFVLDTSGQQDLSTNGATARYLVYPGDTDPGLEPAGTPVNGEIYPDHRILVTGRAIDDVGMLRVEVQISNSAGQGMSSSGNFSTPSIPGNFPWISMFLTSPGSPGSNFSYTSPVIPAGAYTVAVRAVDNYGQVQQTPRVTAVTVQ